MSNLPAKVSAIIDQMRENPQGNWNIRDVEKVCEAVGLTCSAPSRGSHYKVSSVHVPTILTIPARKPIKPVYIRKLIALVDTHLGKSDGSNGND